VVNHRHATAKSVRGEMEHSVRGEMEHSVTARPNFAVGMDVDSCAPDVRAALSRLADENALLRAALAETRARLGDLEEAVDTDPLTGLANDRAFRRELDRVVG